MESFCKALERSSPKGFMEIVRQKQKNLFLKKPLDFSENSSSGAAREEQRGFHQIYREQAAEAFVELDLRLSRNEESFFKVTCAWNPALLRSDKTWSYLVATSRRNIPFKPSPGKTVPPAVPVNPSKPKDSPAKLSISHEIVRFLRKCSQKSRETLCFLRRGFWDLGNSVLSSWKKVASLFCKCMKWCVFAIVSLVVIILLALLFLLWHYYHYVPGYMSRLLEMVE